MSCAEVMYQPYSPYFPYHHQRSAGHHAHHAAACGLSPSATATSATSANLAGPSGCVGLSNSSNQSLVDHKKFGMPKILDTLENSSSLSVAAAASSASSSVSGDYGGRAVDCSIGALQHYVHHHHHHHSHHSSSASAAAGSSSSSHSSSVPILKEELKSHSPVNHESASSAIASVSSAAAAAASVSGSSGPSSSQQQSSSGVSPSSGNDGGNATAGTSGNCSSGGHQQPEAQYVSANCVIFTYYSGDLSAVVDEHFSRALSQPSSYAAEMGKSGLKEGPPMSQRNFPPSFWNCNSISQHSAQHLHHHQSAASSSSGAHSHGLHGPSGLSSALGHSDLGYPTDPYHHTPGAAAAALHIHHQNDPWHYTLTSQASPYSYSGMGPVASSNRFATSQYGSLLLQPSVRNTMRSAAVAAAAAASCTAAGLEKGPSEAAAAWGSARYHEPLTHNPLGHHAMDAANYGATYGGMSAMADGGAASSGSYMYELYKLQSMHSGPRSYR